MAEGKDSVGRPNGGRSQEIARDIDRTRDALDRTVDAIVGKLTPSQLLMEAVNVFRSGSSSIVGRVVDTAREHPVPATIVAAGIGMMFWERSERSSEPRGYGFGYPEPEQGRMSERLGQVSSAVHETTQHAKDTLHDKLEGARETTQHAKETVRETLDGAREATQHAKDVVREKLHDVKDEAQHLKEQARVKVKDAKIGFWQAMDQQPLILGGIALALGATAALMIPRTRREDELLGESRDKLMEKAEDVGRQVLDKGRDVARTAADALREEVREQGLAPDQLAQKVRSAAREAEDAALRRAEEENLVPAGVSEPSGGRGSGGSGSFGGGSTGGGSFGGSTGGSGSTGGGSGSPF